jgi:hypothetical protein
MVSTPPQASAPPPLIETVQFQSPPPEPEPIEHPIAMSSQSQQIFVQSNGEESQVEVSATEAQHGQLVQMEMVQEDGTHIQQGYILQDQEGVEQGEVTQAQLEGQEGQYYTYGSDVMPQIQVRLI